MKYYEINSDTLAIIPYDNGKSKIIEKQREFIVDRTPMEVISYSCLYFGSSYEGRHSATKYLLGISYKSPIIIEESKNIIFFPTSSPKLFDCSWISLKNIVDYKRVKNRTSIIFENNKKLMLNVSYGSLDNQILRAARLESVTRNKKAKK